MHNHDRTMRISQNSLRVRSQHPAMKDCVASFAHHNEAGLDGVSLVDDLLRRMTENNIRFEFNLFLLGAFAQRDETLLIALLPSSSTAWNSALSAGSGGRITAKRMFGFHISCHRQGNVQSVLRMWRRVECNKYPLNSNKRRASHGLHLSFFCGYWPLN